MISTKSIYIPKIFIKKKVSECENIRHFLILNGDNVRISSPQDNTMLSDEVYVEEIYDDSYIYFLDLEFNKLRRDVCTIINNNALFLDVNSKIFLREFTGRHIFPLVSVGEKVNENSRLVVIFTGKREFRYGISKVSGIVFYFTQIGYKPQKYLFIISDDVKVRKVV